MSEHEDITVYCPACDAEQPLEATALGRWGSAWYCRCPLCGWGWLEPAPGNVESSHDHGQTLGATR